MVNILLSGCNGKMGQVITRLAEYREDVKIIAGYDKYDGIKNKYPVYSFLDDVKEKVDVIIDFSNPSALGGLLDYATKHNLPIVIATTGIPAESVSLIKEASKSIPVLFSANMSLGVNLMLDLVKKAAKILEGNFDIEIVEKHHNQKIDAPSGTALAIADALNSALTNQHKYVYDRHTESVKRSSNEIGIHSVRGGTIAGEHTVIFAGNDEIIEIKHTAVSKEIFAVGALKAGIFMYNKEKGLYSMGDLLSV